MYDPPNKNSFNSVEGRFIDLFTLFKYESLFQIIFLTQHLFSLTEFQEAFNLFDNRGDGKIQLNQVCFIWVINAKKNKNNWIYIYLRQVGECLRALGQNPTESDVKKTTQQLKADDRISFEVFLPIYQAISKSRSGDTADDFIEGLRHFDKDASGFISTAELRHLLTTLGEKLTDDEVEQLLVNQEDSQGNVNYEEFVRLVMNG